MPSSFSAGVRDSLSNLAASLGAGTDKAASDAFVVLDLDRSQIEAMYRGDWLARKVVDIVPYGTQAKVVFGKDSIKLSWGDDVYVELSDKTALVRVPDGGTVKLGKEAEKGDVMPVKLVTGQADSVKAKMG